MRKQTQMINRTAALLQTLGSRRSEHRCYAEIVADVTTQNSECK
jgi:hypothetical protein